MTLFHVVSATLSSTYAVVTVIQANSSASSIFSKTIIELSLRGVLITNVIKNEPNFSIIFHKKDVSETFDLASTLLRVLISGSSDRLCVTDKMFQDAVSCL